MHEITLQNYFMCDRQKKRVVTKPDISVALMVFERQEMSKSLTAKNILFVFDLFSVIDHVHTTISMNTDPGQTNATLDWARPDLAEHLAMYNLTTHFYQGSMFPIGVNTVTRVATGPCGKNITLIYDVIVIGEYMVDILQLKLKTLICL